MRRRKRPRRAAFHPVRGPDAAGGLQKGTAACGPTGSAGRQEDRRGRLRRCPAAIPRTHLPRWPHRVSAVPEKAKCRQERGLGTRCCPCPGLAAQAEDMQRAFPRGHIGKLRETARQPLRVADAAARPCPRRRAQTPCASILPPIADHRDCIESPRHGSTSYGERCCWSHSAASPAAETGKDPGCRNRAGARRGTPACRNRDS